MSVVYNRKLYMPSTGSPAISTVVYGAGWSGIGAWTDTSNADRRGMAWDSPSGSSFGSKSASVLTGVGTRYVLLRQYVSPALVASRLNDNVTGVGTTLFSPCHFRAKIDGFTGVFSSSGCGIAKPAFIVYIVDSGGAVTAIRYTPVRTGGLTINNFFQTINSPSPTTSAPIANPVITAGSYLIVEVGFSVQTVTQAFTMNFEFGDNIAHDLVNSDSIQGNSWGELNLYVAGGTAVTNGGWTYTGPLAPTILPKTVSLVTSQQPSNSSQLNDLSGNSLGFNS